MNNETVKAIVTGVVALIALVNVILQAFGISPLPIDESLVYTIVSSIFALVMLIIAWWKNQNVTKAAQKAQTVLVELKQEEKKAA